MKTTPAANPSADTSAHVKSKIYLFEIAMEEGGNAEYARIEKKESDEADKMASRPLVELGAARNQRLQNRWFDLEIEQHQVAPLSRQKNPGHFSPA
ncbi:MAG TPA: hypothetical protein VIG78_09630 [Gemmatimonadaceae bacterium]